MENKNLDSIKTEGNIVGCDTSLRITDARLSAILVTQYNQFIGRYLEYDNPIYYEKNSQLKR